MPRTEADGDCRAPGACTEYGNLHNRLPRIEAADRYSPQTRFERTNPVWPSRWRTLIQGPAPSSTTSSATPLRAWNTSGAPSSARWRTSASAAVTTTVRVSDRVFFSTQERSPAASRTLVQFSTWTITSTGYNLLATNNLFAL